MVWQQALYLVNLLCKFIPCDYNFPPPDTSLSEPQAFKDLITLGFDEKDRDNPGGGGGILKIGGGGGNGWGDFVQDGQEIDYTGNDPLVAITKTGKLRGYWMRVVGGRKIRAFEGIPYAEPPIGYFRFSEPSPKIPWSGLLWANKKGPKCLQFSQIELKRIIGSEDCLCLNIYAPKIPSAPLTSSNQRQGTQKMEKFPVLIFIHGGGFQIGGGNDYGPSYLLQQDLILVTFNYRVGVFGFMSTGDKASPGNYGLKDQSMAIQWVYENIDVFNGDPSRITLVGQEAGGASVHLQMLSPRARPFFQAGISMSGTAFNSWVFCSKEAAHSLAKYYAKKFSCPVHTSEAIVSCLRRVDSHDLAKAQIHFLDDLPIPLYLFRPVLEDLDQKEVAFITQTPEELYRSNAVARIPWIAGFTEDEGLTFLLPSVFRGTIKHLRANWNTLAPDFLDYQNILGVDMDDVTKKINWLYFKQKTPTTATIKTFSDAISLRFTVTGVHKALQAHSTLAPTYGYMFSYNGKYNLATLAGIKPHEWGVGQGEDLFYLLNSTHLYQGFLKSDYEMILAKIMVNLFGNFAAKRYPTFTMENREDFQIWNPITDPRNMSFLLIHKKIKMIPEPYLKQSVYWESIGLPDTTPYINTTEHYKDYHFITATLPPPPSRALTGPYPPSNTLSRNNHNFGISSTPDVFNLRGNLGLRQTTNPNIKTRSNEDGEVIKVKDEEVVGQGLGQGDLDETDLLKSDQIGNQPPESIKDSTPAPEVKIPSPTPLPYDEDALFLPPWNPFGRTSPPPTEVKEEVTPTPTTFTGSGIHDNAENLYTSTTPIPSPPPDVEVVEGEEEEKIFQSPKGLDNSKDSDQELSTPSTNQTPSQVYNGPDDNEYPNISKKTFDNNTDNLVNGHQYPSTTPTTPHLPNSLDLLEQISPNLEQIIFPEGDPTTTEEPLKPLNNNNSTAEPTTSPPLPNGEDDLNPDGVEEADIEKYSLGFKQDSFESSPYQDDDDDDEDENLNGLPALQDKSTNPPPTSTTSTTTSMPRVLYPSRYHSPYVSNEISDHRPYNIMK